MRNSRHLHLVRDTSISDRIHAECEAAQSIPWDWADYEALRLLALRRVIDDERETEPVLRVLQSCYWGLEDERFRAEIAEALRTIERTERKLG